MLQPWAIFGKHLWLIHLVLVLVLLVLLDFMLSAFLVSSLLIDVCVCVVCFLQNKISGCFLYSDKSVWGAASNCNYAVAMAIIFQLLYGVFRLITLILLILGKFNSE